MTTALTAMPMKMTESAILFLLNFIWATLTDGDFAVNRGRP